MSPRAAPQPSPAALLDMIEEIHLSLLLEDDRYRELLEAVRDDEAVEGALWCDDIAAAIRIRDAAKKRISPVKNQKIATIVKALHVVLRRYGLSRKERRSRFDAEAVAP
jgi:hypothetical protein